MILFSRKKLTALIMVLFYLSNFGVVKAQAPASNGSIAGKVSIASPTAAALGKYVDIPVNMHTGVPQIGLPIYTVKEGSLELPIGLSYQASGLKLGELASWVGAGWSLTGANGVITRTVRGTPDERLTSEYTRNEKGHLSEMGYNSYLMDNVNYLGPCNTESDKFAWFNEFNDGTDDGEPDLFFFNFNGYSGKFYFDDAGIPVLIPEGDYKIEYVYTPSNKSIQKFIITVPNGTKYYFGVTDATNDIDPIEKTHNYHVNGVYSYLGTNNTISSWYINKVVSPDNKFTINFEYVGEEYSYKSVVGLTTNNLDYHPVSTNHYKYYSHWQQGVRLSKITTPSLIVNFEPGITRQDLNNVDSWNSISNFNVNTQAKALGAIKVSDNANNICTKFNFNYDYFQSASGISATDSKRLKLNDIQEVSCTGTPIKPAHTFEYFTEPIPNRLSFAQDHWGYINGKTDNTRLIPTFVEKSFGSLTFAEFKGADREAYWPAMRAGTLKKISYPTGGFTEFEFEPNTTPVNYTTYNKTFAFTMTMGYDANSTTVTQNRTFNTNAYSAELTNTGIGGTATFNGGGTTLNINSIPAGESAYSNRFVNAGTYTLSLSKNPTPYGGNGVTVNVYEWIPEAIQENKVVGGLRAKKITHSNDASNTNTIITNYEYNLSNGQSSGHLYSKPTYVQYVRNDYLKDAGVTICYGLSTPYWGTNLGYEYVGGNNTIAPSYRVSSNSLRPMETTQGNHIGYNEVQQYQTNNGHSVYRYYGSNIWDNNTNNVANTLIEVGLPQTYMAPNYPEAPPVTDFKRGELKYEGHFNQANQLLKESYYYPEYTNSTYKTPALLIGNGEYLLGLPTFYELFSAKKTKTTIEEYIYESGIGAGGNYIKNSTENFYESSYHNQVTKSITNNSKGEQLISKTKYVLDMREPNCVTLPDGLTTYQNDCITCQNQYNASRNASGHNNAYWQFWDYQILLKCKSIARINYVNTRKNYFNPSIAGSITNCTNTLKANANAQIKPIIELQTQNQNLPLEITTFKNSNLTSAQLSSYDFAPSSTTTVYLKETQSIKLAAPSASFTPIAIASASNLVKDSRYTKDGECQIKDGNIVEVKGRNGIITSYIWGYNNSYPVAQIVGANYATAVSYIDMGIVNNLLTTDVQMRSELQKIRTGLNNTNALVTTYTYKPLIGISSQVDVNARLMYYEYDGAGRLTTIKNQDGNIIKKLCYKYNGQQEDCGLFYSIAMSITLQRNNCAANEQGSYVTFTVPAGMFSSAVSQADADQLASNHLNANGQAYANTNGTCTYVPTCNWNNCGNQGEAYACINGSCEMGIQVITGSYFDNFCGCYMCVYHYEYSDGSWSQDYTISTGGAQCFVTY